MIYLVAALPHYWAMSVRLLSELAAQHKRSGDHRSCVLRGGAMIGADILRPEPLPSMWKVILFHIWQAEQRDRILSDWEDNVFGIHLSREEKQRLH